MKDEQRSSEPHDRLTRICDAMIDTLREHPEADELDQCVIFIDTEEKGGLVLSGYEHDSEAIAAVLLHLRAIFRANGSDLSLVPIKHMGQG